MYDYLYYNIVIIVIINVVELFYNVHFFFIYIYIYRYLRGDDEIKTKQQCLTYVLDILVNVSLYFPSYYVVTTLCVYLYS